MYIEAAAFSVNFLFLYFPENDDRAYLSAKKINVKRVSKFEI